MRSGREPDLMPRTSPAWLRPAAWTLVALAHAGFIFGLPWPRSPYVAVPQPLEISVVAQGEPAPPAPQSGDQVADVKPSETQSADAPPDETVQAAESAPEQPPEQPPPEVAAAPAETPAPVEPPREQPPQPTPRELAATAPAIMAPPDAPTEQTAAAKPREIRPDQPRTVVATREPEPEVTAQPVPVPERAQKPAEEIKAQRRQEEIENAKRKAAEEARKREAAKKEAEKKARAAKSAQAATRVASRGQTGNTGAAAGGMSAAAYRALIVAEINRRKHYPEAARPAHAQGTVMIAFTVGRSGRVTSHSITRSSGNAILDASANQTVAALSLPPPPNGSYSALAPINFTLR